MHEPLNVFIPAAGLGERLQPITFHLPKSLIPVTGRPLLELILEKVFLLPVERVGINLHHKKDAVAEWLSRSAFRTKIVTFPEEPLRGTGGALKNAEKLLSEGIFLVHNCDVLSEINLGQLVEFHRSSGNIATLAVHDYPKFNSVVVDSNGLVTGIGKSSARTSTSHIVKAFTGIAVYDPGFLRFLPAGISGVVDAWMLAIASGDTIGTLDVTGCYWSDLGTPAAYAAAVIQRLRSEGETIYLHPSASGCHRAEMNGFVVMEEGSEAAKGARLRNCIMLPSARAGEDAFLENCIVGPDFRLSLNEGEFLGLADGGTIFLIGTGGSDRKYYRVRKAGGSAVLVQYDREDSDFDRHLAFTVFFRNHGISVPELLKSDPERREALFEDLGDLSLYSWLKCPRPEEDVEILYRKVLDRVIVLHAEATVHVSECPILKERIFDYEHLRWETAYFMEKFVKGIGQRAVNDALLLEDEFHRLAVKVDSLPKAVIHRDLQSQNIMVTGCAIPWFIDYQGARIGPPAYDIASLLWDPYYRLERDVRDRLVDHYMRGMSEKTGCPGFNGQNFRDALLHCRLQRHMQALGAYGFLSSVKGKKYFLKHAVEGLQLLKEEVAMARDEYPALHALVLAL